MTQPLLARRNLLTNLLAAPFVITTPGLLMPVKRVPLYTQADLHKLTRQKVREITDSYQTWSAREFDLVRTLRHSQLGNVRLYSNAQRAAVGLGHSPLTIVRGA